MESREVRPRRITFRVDWDGPWWLAVDERDVPAASPSIELLPSSVDYLVVAWFAGPPGEAFQVTVTGAKFARPLKGKLPEGGKDVAVARLHVAVEP